MMPRVARIVRLLFQREEGWFVWLVLGTGALAVWVPCGLRPSRAESVLLLMQIAGTLSAIYLLNDQRSSMGARGLWELLKAWAREFIPRAHDTSAALRGVEASLDTGLAVGTVRGDPATPVAEQLRLIWESLGRLEGKLAQTSHDLEVHRRATTEELAKLKNEFKEQVDQLERELQERLTAKPLVMYLSWWLILASTVGQLILKVCAPLA